jgi:hypothetical protein
MRTNQFFCIYSPDFCFLSIFAACFRSRPVGANGNRGPVEEMLQLLEGFLATFLQEMPTIETAPRNR